MVSALAETVASASAPAKAKALANLYIAMFPSLVATGF